MSGWVKIPQVGQILSPRQKRVAALLRHGATPGQIARQLRTRVEYVEDDIYRIHAAEYREERIKMTRKKWTEEEVETLVTMYLDGKTAREIAEQVGHPTAAIATKLDALRSAGKLHRKTEDAAPAEQETEQAGHNEQAREIERAEQSAALEGYDVPAEVIAAVKAQITETETDIMFAIAEVERLTRQRDILQAWLAKNNKEVKTA